MRAFVLSLIFASCATLEGAKPKLQLELEATLLGTKVYAQCALHRSFFFDDPTRDLLSSSAPGARVLALDAQGKTLPLRAKTNRVHPGSIWWVERISSPTAFESVMRPLRSPRHLIWVHLRNGSSQAIVVVPESISKAAEIAAWFGEHFALSEPAGLEKLGPSMRSAVNHGRPLVDMNGAQLRLALCRPDRVFKDVSALPPVEKWIYLHQGGEHRMAVLSEGKATGKLLPLSPKALLALEAR
jgi:hypothetical protein